MANLKFKITQDNISCGVAIDKSDIEKAQKLRYDMLVMNYNNHNTNNNSTDASEYDDICEHLIAVDETTGQVVGTYRVLPSDLLPKDAKYISEKEFDLTNLKNSGAGLVELSRAVVHPDYRNGVVIKMLWRVLDTYRTVHHTRYLFGTASYHGTDVSKYANSFAWLKDKYLVDEKLNCPPKSPNAPMGDVYDIVLAKQETPALIRGYLTFGSWVSDGIYIDKEFGSVDILTILDLEHLNEAFWRRMK